MGGTALQAPNFSTADRASKHAESAAEKRAAQEALERA
jgi:hypothetical protein